MAKHANHKPTRAQKIAEVKRLKAATQVFLDYNDRTSWAFDKIQSGTADLSPEAVKFMEYGLAERADNAAHKKALADQNKALDLAAKEANNREAEL